MMMVVRFIMISMLIGGAACWGAATTRAIQDERFTLMYDKDQPAGFSPHYKSREEWERRADFLRHQVLVSQGLWPMPGKTELKAVIHGRVEGDGYTVEKVFFASLPGHYVSGTLYRPREVHGKAAAVLLPYGHWPEGRFNFNSPEKVKKEIESGAETMECSATAPLQAAGVTLALMGCVAFLYDMVGYGDSKRIAHMEGFTDVQAILRLQSFMGLQTWNSIRAIDFLATLPEVDRSRIAAAGASGGGTQTILLSIVDPRVAVAVPMVMVSLNMQGGCVCENAPLLRVGTNNVELAALFAPRPQCAISAKAWTHDFQERGLPEMKAIYSLYGAQDEMQGTFFPFGHNFNAHSRRRMYEFLNEQLKLGLATPIEEKAFVPMKPAELSVYDQEHPVPGDAADAERVKQYMTGTSDAQIAEIAKDPSAYRAMLHTALEAMVVDAMPGGDQVQVLESVGEWPDSGGTWSAIVSRKGTGERIGCKAIVPQGWNGQLVIWAHPDGSASLSAAEVQRTLDRQAAVLAADSFMLGGFRPWAGTTVVSTTRKSPPKVAYAGYVLGYNRSAMAQRVHDLLSVMALARGIKGVKSISLVAIGEAGPSALLARALAGDSIARAAIDMNRFDFDRVHEDSDPMLLPGAVKYGGMDALAGLCARESTLLVNRRRDAEMPDRSKMVDFVLVR